MVQITNEVAGHIEVNVADRGVHADFYNGNVDLHKFLFFCEVFIINLFLSLLWLSY